MPFVASSILWIPHIKERQRCLSIALTHMEATVLFLWKDWLSNPWWGYHLRVSVVVVQSLSHVDSLRPYGLQHASLHCPSQTPEFAQTHVLQVSDAIQPSHPLSSPSPPPFNLSQHYSLFRWFSSSHQVCKELEFQLQPQSFWWMFRVDFL